MSKEYQAPSGAEHPITPPPKLLQRWFDYDPFEAFTIAAQWGADQELEACCEWLKSVGLHTYALHTARRPKPPSLKEQALEVVTGLEKRWDLQCDLTLLRRALEQLDD